MMPVPARVTVADATAFRATMLAACASGERDFDLAPLADYDSAAIAILLEVQRAAGSDKARFLNVPANLRKLATLYGVDSLLFDTPAETTGAGRG